ncbi:MAG: hypothetical protein KatS3mg094_462 [Candidatus Parcubacteria bacterium]|nr:MAG: hypothetical protein KatS3mg094_462 [Candidatus Parcubacteria bacterium]
MRLLINLIFIILFFFFINSVFNSLIPSYRNYLNSVEEKNKVENELMLTKSVKEQFEFLQLKDVVNIVKLKKDNYFDYFLPSNYIDYELTMFINQLFYIAGFPQPNVYSFNQEEIIHPQIKNAKVSKLSFSIMEEETLDNIIKLISTLENSSRIFEIETLDLKRGKENNLINSSLKISTYYFLPK